MLRSVVLRAISPVGLSCLCVTAMLAASGHWSRVSAAEPAATGNSSAEPDVLSPEGRRAFQEKLQRAIPAVTAQIARQPSQVGLYSTRGDLYFFRGDFSPAVADYEKMLALDADLDARHWRLGLAWYYAGKFDASARQFEKYFATDDVDRENGLWRCLAQLRSSGLASARKSMLKYSKPDRGGLGDVYRMYAGETTSVAILDSIRSSRLDDEERLQRLFYAELYIGLFEAAQEHHAAAVEHLRLAVHNPWPRAAGYGPGYMWQLARVQALLSLEALEAKNPPPSSSASLAVPAGVISLGSRRELFIDTFLIERLTGVKLQLQRPRDEGIALRFDQPWERSFCGYCTVLHEAGRYRLYYRGYKEAKTGDGSDVEVTCVAESADGKAWTKPKLGLFEVAGTRENNVILAGMSPLSHNFSPLRDSRPGIPAKEKYKALAGTGPSGLYALVSADGLQWRKLQERPVFTEKQAVPPGPGGAFDSQNVAFWSDQEGQYLMYYRVFAKGMRSIYRTTSADFLNWNTPEQMTFGDRPVEHLYTNQTHPYFRAPHISIGLAARFMPGRKVLTAEEAAKIHVDPGYFGDCSDGVLLTTRGGHTYQRTFMEGFLRPRLGLEDWVSRTNYPALNVVPTGSEEMSFYANHNYGQPSAHVRRYSLRPDGFAAVNAPYEGGELLTRPFTFNGNELRINFATSAAGGVKVEIHDPQGNPLPGYTLADAVESIGNDLERPVRWKQGTSVASLSGRPLRLRIALHDADLYSLQFHSAP